MTINLNIYKKLDYKIPNELKIWFGDDWIWGQIRRNNKIAGVFKNYFCLHVRSTTTSNPDVQAIIDKDIKIIEENGDWYKKNSELIHQKYI